MIDRKTVMQKLFVPERRTVGGHSFLCVSGGKSTNASLPPLVFIHGASVGAWFWENFLIAAGQAGFDAYALDLLGHGESAVSPNIGKVSIEQYVLDVKHFLDLLSKEHSPFCPVVFGHSMGGLIAQKLAEMYPVAGLVLLASAPPRGIAFREGEGFGVSLFERTHLAWRALSNQSIFPSEELVRGSFVRLHDKRRIKELYKKFTPESGCAAREIVFGSIAVDARSICAPTLVISGAKDNVLHPDISREIGERYHGEYCQFPNHGHMLIIEPGWEEVAGYALSWVKQMVSQTAR